MLKTSIRRDILTMSYFAGAGHIPSALSMADYLPVILGQFVRPGRDRIVLGKPYGAQAYYAALVELGVMSGPVTRYCDPHAPEWSYIADRTSPFVDFIDDTMGNALSVAAGMSLVGDKRVWVNISDAYLQEGTAWEAIMFAGAHGLGRLFVSIDNNHMQASGLTDEILPVEPIAERLAPFGWATATADGHDPVAVREACSSLLADSESPKALILNTVKGYGVSFMQSAEWHYRRLDIDSYRMALAELGRGI